MSRLIALDASVIVSLAGGKSKHPDGELRARAAIRFHGKEGDSVAIPAPAFAEVCHCGPELFHEIMTLAMNAPAAVLANRLTPAIREAADGSGCSRRALKIDALILAVAEERRAAVLYTEDPWFEVAAIKAGLRIQVRDLPPAPIGGLQTSLLTM